MSLSTKTGIKTNTTLRILHNTPANNENQNIMCTIFECPEPGSISCSLNPVCLFTFFAHAQAKLSQPEVICSRKEKSC